MTGAKLEETPAESAEGTSPTRPKVDLAARTRRYLIEMAVGLVLAGLIVLALIATVGSVPFIYAGF